MHIIEMINYIVPEANNPSAVFALLSIDSFSCTAFKLYCSITQRLSSHGHITPISPIFILLVTQFKYNS